ncbi:MAG: hypothetical protein HC814_04855 [Rhodobacteraceae bacterium]|nr:hypothetical protein [Paracoccaceae bacterium]
MLREANVKGMRGRVIHPSTVQNMLQNPIYYGAFRFKGELHDGIHEPMVTKALFDRCQKVMSIRSKPKSRGLKPLLYRGLLRCSVCGGMITSETQKGHVYLHCSKRVEPCKHEYRPAVREESVTEQIDAVLERVSLPDEWEEPMLARLAGEQDRLKAAADARRVELESTRQGLVTKLHRAEEGWLDGLVSKARYREIQSDLTGQRQSLDQHMKDLEEHGLHRFEPMARFIKACIQAKKVASHGSREERLDFFRKVGSNPKLEARQLVSPLRGAWQVVENLHF